MKRFLISSIIFSILILTACAPAPTAISAPSATPSLTPTATPTATETPTLTPTESPLTFDTAPAELDGFTKSNPSTVNPDLVIYRDIDGNAQIAYDLKTKEKLTLPEAKITEVDMNDGSKWEMKLFTDSQEALKSVAEDAFWFTGDSAKDWGKLKMKEKLQNLLNENKAIKDININAFRGATPPYPNSENSETFFTFYTCEINGKEGLVLSYLINEGGDFKSIFLDNPNVQEKMTDLWSEAVGKEFDIPEN